MGTFITLTRRELAGHFLSFRGYVILAGVQFLLGLSLLLIVDALNNRPFDLPITEKFPSTGLFWLVLLLVTPVITMRTFAREKSTGTFETLMTTPVSDLQVVLAKFSGALGFYLLTFLPMAAFPFILKHYAAASHGFPRVITTLNQHVRQNLSHQLLGRILGKRHHPINGCKARQHRHPVSQRVDRPPFAFELGHRFVGIDGHHQAIAAGFGFL